MKSLSRLILASCFLFLIAVQHSCADDDRIGGMQLLEGYEHEPLQGFDSIVGRIEKEDGLRITYEIGRIPRPGGISLGGQFRDRPKLTPEDQLRWYREQSVNSQPVHLAYRTDDQLLVSFPEKGMNFSVEVGSAEQMADALLMILTYPGHIAEDASDE